MRFNDIRLSRDNSTLPDNNRAKLISTWAIHGNRMRRSIESDIIIRNHLSISLIKSIMLE